MTKYETVKCEKCGEEYSTFPPLKAKHEKSCKGAKVVVEQRKTDPSKIKDKLAREQYEKALAKQAQLLVAPEVFAAEATLDENKALVAAYAPECLGPNATHHAYIGDPREADRDAQKGYLPVFDDDGNQVKRNGMPLYTIPIELHAARVRAAQNESRSRLSRNDEEYEKMKEISASESGVSVSLEKKEITQERLYDG